MILIDAPFPDRCYDCLCSYWFRSGKHNGKLMCQAAEHDGDLHRPDDCPMKEVKS